MMALSRKLNRANMWQKARQFSAKLQHARNLAERDAYKGEHHNPFGVGSSERSHYDACHDRACQVMELSFVPIEAQNSAYILRSQKNGRE